MSLLAKVNEPFALTLRLSPPLSWSVTAVPAPERPETVPPTEYVVAPVPGVPGAVPSMLPPTQVVTAPVPLARMPGAPPDRLVSVALMSEMQLRYRVTVDPTAVSSSTDPAGSALTGSVQPSCVQPPLRRLKIISSGLP